MKSDYKTVKTVALQKVNENIVKKVSADIEKIGGSIWNKGEHSRAYFPECYVCSDGMDKYFFFCDAYIDLKTGEFCCDVVKKGFDNQNKYSARDLWVLHRDEMLSELKK